MEQDFAYSLDGYAYRAYVPGVIEPCVVFNETSTRQACGAFHLLTCGHIISIQDHNRRCGRNCQHTVASMASAGEGQVQLHKPLLTPLTTHSPKLYIPQISITQSIDVLYCEVCYGIPFERYKLLTSKEAPSTLRTAFSLTRSMLQSTFAVHLDNVNALLCSPVFDRSQVPFHWQYAHRLRCGHVVLSVNSRPCAANCSDGSSCRDKSFPWQEELAERLEEGPGERLGDVIFCQECIARAELVHERFARLEASKPKAKSESKS
jgi:ribosomal protein L37E